MMDEYALEYLARIASALERIAYLAEHQADRILPKEARTVDYMHVAEVAMEAVECSLDVRQAARVAAQAAINAQSVYQKPHYQQPTRAGRPAGADDDLPF